MKITLLCNRCGKKLTDKYSAKKCFIHVGHQTELEMECVFCCRYVNVSLSTKTVEPRKYMEKLLGEMK